MTQAHRFPLCLQLLRVSRKLSDDLRCKVLGDNLMLACIVIQLVKCRQEGSTESVPGERRNYVSVLLHNH